MANKTKVRATTYSNTNVYLGGKELNVKVDGGLALRGWGSYTRFSRKGNVPIVAFEVSIYVVRGVTVKESNWNQAKRRDAAGSDDSPLAQKFAELLGTAMASNRDVLVGNGTWQMLD